MKARDLSNLLSEHPDANVLLEVGIRRMVLDSVSTEASSLVLHFVIPFDRVDALYGMAEELADLEEDTRREVCLAHGVKGDRELLKLFRKDERLLRAAAHKWLGMEATDE